MDTNWEYVKMLKESADRVMNYITPIIINNKVTLNEFTVSYFTASVGKLGLCRYKNIVELNTKLLDGGNELDIDSVMAHEILHCVKEAKGHGKLWKQLAKEVSEIAPFNIYTYSNTTIKNNEDLLKGYKYVVKCKECGRIIRTNQKKTAYINYYKNREVNCHCGGKIEVEEN